MSQHGLPCSSYRRTRARRASPTMRAGRSAGRAPDSCMRCVTGRLLRCTRVTPWAARLQCMFSREACVICSDVDRTCLTWWPNACMNDRITHGHQSPGCHHVARLAAPSPAAAAGCAPDACPVCVGGNPSRSWICSTVGAWMLVDSFTCLHDDLIGWV